MVAYQFLKKINHKTSCKKKLLQQTALITAACALHEIKRSFLNPKTVIRRWSVRPVNRTRDINGAFKLYIEELRNVDPQLHKEFLRMSKDRFDHLLSLIECGLKKHKTTKQPVTPAMHLAVTLRFLSSTASMSDVKHHFKLGRSTVSGIIYKTCAVIWDILSPMYLKFPGSMNEWKIIANEFWNLWQFPLCLGALDGKHIRLQAPPLSGSKFFNHKGFHSIVLMACCDAKYRFTYVDIGGFGRSSDAGLFNNSQFGSKLINRRLNLPGPSALPGSTLMGNYAFIGDEGFPFKPNLMRPYTGRCTGNLDYNKRIFNYRLSRARRIIENSFGILSSRFRIFRSEITATPANAELLTKAAICLHNYLLTEECGDLKFATNPILMSFAEHFEFYFANEEFADIQFNIEGEIIPAHRNVVTRDSETFKTMLSVKHRSMKNEREIKIEDIEKSTFKAFLWFQYTNKIDDFSIKALSNLYKCADRFGCNKLMEKCVENLEEDCQIWSPRILEVFTNLRSVFVTHGDLHEKCVQLIDKNIIDAMESQHFMTLPVKDVQFLLSRDELNAKEHELLYGIIQWGKEQLKFCDAEFSTLEEVLEPLIYFIRCTSFSTMEELVPVLNLLVNAEGSRILSHEIIGKIINSIPETKEGKEIKESLKFDSTPRKNICHGQILLLGGELNGECTSNIYAYNFETGCKLMDYKLLEPRANHAAIFNKSHGEIIVNGNSEHLGIKITESIVFDQNNCNSMEKISFIGGENEYEQRLKYATSCFLGGFFYRIGGAYSCICEAFDVNSRKWNRIADLPKKISQASAVACKNKQGQDVIFVFGGRNGKDYFDKVYEYCPWSNLWILRDDLKMPMEINRFSATFFNETKIIICGGFDGEESRNEVYCLDLKTEEWSELPKMKYARDSHQAVIYANKLVILGGEDTKSLSVMHIEIFDGEKWREATQIIDKYKNFAAVVV